SLDWTGDAWDEVGTDDGTAAGGSIRIVAGELLLEGTGGNPERRIERDVDLTGFGAASLSFDWRCVGDMEQAGAEQDTVHIEVSADGGGSWITLESKVGEIDMCLEPGDNDAGSERYDLAALLDADPSDSRIRFRYTISAADEDFFVDNLEVSPTLFFSNLAAPGDNAFERLPVGVSGARELRIDFPASGALAGIDFCLGSIRDKAWLDANDDGLFDLSEMGIAGVTVTLLSDPDGIPNNGDEVVIATTTTDANGNFGFDGLDDGDFLIQITDTGGELSDLGGTTAPGIARELSVSVVDGEDVVGINFGYNAPGTIGDRIWNDASGDGVDDPGELGIGGVTVDLIGAGPDGILGNGDDVVVATTTTAADGSYLFSGLPPGDYTVEVTDTGSVLSGYTQTGDPDATLDGEGTASIALNGSDLSMDFGYQLATLPDVSGNVFEDFDIDGLDDGASEPGFAGVTIELRDAAGNVLATTTTDSAGDYSFLDLPAGDYTVAVTDEAGVLLGYSLTSGLDALDFTVVASDITGLDFGYVRMPAYASIGDQVWLDSDGDGIPGPNEAGLTGVVLDLYDAGPDGLRGTADDVLVATTVTDADGRYLFNDLPAGDYYVDVVETSLPETTPGDLDETTYPAGVDPSAVIALSEGEVYRDADFGYVPATGTAALGDRVWYDADGDGLQDDGEIGIEGVDILIYGAAGASCNPGPCVVTTGPDGIWLATGLALGDYMVTFDSGTLPAGVNA
ncbi:MAG: carboxypeptidase regulatory-like domain-containing protein, partial [Acidimicrobiia bacterium]|nr:carboxypeptidase regulatory-like domain-containing protein [Acidimicrobiia bacterium]